MGLTTPKSPNLRETDTANARYTDLNRFHKNGAKLLINGNDFLNGLLNIPPGDSRVVTDFIEDGSKIKVGDIVLVGNRIGKISAIDFDNGGTEATLDITVIEENMPLPQGAVEADENFIDPTRRQVDYIIGIQTDTAEALRRTGGTTFGLTVGTPAIISAKNSDPATWGDIARAARKYQGLGKVTVTFDAFTDAGVTDYATSDLNIYPADQDQVAAALIQITTDGTGDATASLEEGVRYIVRDGAGALAEVQPHPASGSCFVVPTDNTPLTVVIHNAAAV